jgi:hypothetical protein
MIGFRAKLDQLDEVGSGLGPPQIFANPAEWIPERDFSEGVQARFAAARDLDFRFEEQVELPGERTLRAARSSRRGLNAA